MKTLRKVPIIAFISLFVLSFSSCDKDTVSSCIEHTVSPCNEDPTKVNLRIKNVSEYQFCNVVLWPFDEKVNCGIVKSGESTCYRSFDTAYRYGYIQLFIDDEEFILQPFDFVGEVPLDPGNYTYSIDVVDFETRRLSLDFSID